MRRWASPFGMYYDSSTNVLEMVPPAEIYSTTTVLDRNIIQAVLCSKLELQHNISTSKACLRGDQQPDPLQSKMGNLTIDFFLNPFEPAKLSFPPPWQRWLPFYHQQVQVPRGYSPHGNFRDRRDARTVGLAPTPHPPRTQAQCMAC